MTEKEYLASLSEKNNADMASSQSSAQSQEKSSQSQVTVDSSDTLTRTNVQEKNTAQDSDSIDFSYDEQGDFRSPQQFDEEELQGFPTPETLAESIKKSQENDKEKDSETDKNLEENPSNNEDLSSTKQEEEDSNPSNDTVNQDKGEEHLPATKNSDLAEKPKTKKKKAKKKKEEKEGPMTLLDHLKELRVRLTRVVIIVFVGFFACYSIAEPAYNFLAIPLTENMPEGSTLMYTSPPGAFFVYLKISLLLSFFISSPFSFYQIWAFVAPGLYKEEKAMLIPLSLSSAFFFIGGATFCYYFVFPIAFKFFMGFATLEIVPMISIEEYLSFVLKLLIAFGLVFEMPLFSFFLARMGVLTAERMRKWRKYAILLIFITAALLTPPDIFSQLLMAGPMIILYEISILLTVFVARQKKAEKELLDGDSAQDEEKNTEE